MVNSPSGDSGTRRRNQDLRLWRRKRRTRDQVANWKYSRNFEHLRPCISAHLINMKLDASLQMYSIYDLETGFSRNHSIVSATPSQMEWEVHSQAKALSFNFWPNHKHGLFPSWKSPTNGAYHAKIGSQGIHMHPKSHPRIFTFLIFRSFEQISRV